MPKITQNGFNFVLVSLGIIAFLFQYSAAQGVGVRDSCLTAKGLNNLNLTLFHGQWFVAAQSPDSPYQNQSCSAWNFMNETNPVTFISTYNSNPDKLWTNETTPALQINIIQGVFTVNSTDGNVQVYKILDTDYETFAFVCTYENQTEASNATGAGTTQTPEITSESTTSSEQSTQSSTTSSNPPNSESKTIDPRSTDIYSYILVRNRSLNSTQLSNLTTKADDHYGGFDKLSPVVQTDKCTNGASTMFPVLTMILAIVLAAVHKL